MSDDSLTISDLNELVTAGKELAAEIDLPVVLEKVLTTAGKLTESYDGSVLLFNPSAICDGERGSFYFASAIGEKASFLLGTKGKDAADKDQVSMRSVAGQVFTSGRSIIKNNVTNDPNHNKTVDAVANFVTQSMICVPLTAAGEKIGVMQILNKKLDSYTERDQLVLEAFANQSAVAIRNARLFQEVLAHMGFPVSVKKQDRTIDILQKLRQPARREYMTLLMVDMRGFTQFCNVINNPYRIQLFLNEYFDFLYRQIVMYNGTINKFLGDGLLAFFREDKHERDAVRCAFAITSSFGSFVRDWRRNEKIGENINFLDIGIGIVSDQVIVGSIGSMNVRDFTAIGTPVNLVNSLQENARDGNRIIVNETTLEEAKDLGLEFEGPFNYDLKRPGQTYGHPYQTYRLKAISSSAGSTDKGSQPPPRLEIGELYVSKYLIQGGGHGAVGDNAEAHDFTENSE